MINDIINDTKAQMDKAIESLKRHLAGIRTGRASATLLDGVRVEYYGQTMPLNQVSNITAPDARLLMVKPWDKSMLKPIEKAIAESSLGLNPSSDSDVVRVPLPSLTEERRREFVKQAKHRAEEARVSIRNVRRDTNELLKDAVKEGSVSEDEEKRTLKTVQDLTDKYIKDVDKLCEVKEAEIMEV